MGFQVTPVVKNLPANAGDGRDVGSIPGWGRSSGVGNGIPLQYSCLENSMDRGAWPQGRKELGTTEYTQCSTCKYITHTKRCVLSFISFSMYFQVESLGLLVTKKFEIL